METIKNNEVKVLTLEEKKAKLIAENNEQLKIALDKLEKTEAAAEQREVVKTKITKELDTLKNAISANSNNISSLIDKFEKDYYTSFYSNVGEARNEITKRHTRELNELNKQHKLEKENFKVIYNLPFDLDAKPKDENISVEERIKYALAKRSNGSDNTPDYRVLIIDNKAVAVIKNDDSPMLSSINVPYTSNNIGKVAILKADVLIKECNKNLSIVPNANRMSIEDIKDEQKEKVQDYINKKKVETSPDIKTDLGGDLGKL
ncbi:hypothetical protein FNW52_12565 [Flavobacterium sp. ZT3R18]|uniref:hypothetical protein n=1 Tax=Flavobacterium sp. ZT3R18 TaxID=2594429 RepID=UPI00117A2598|nr:hypothetical protein [Flavobacterium sp. ZT3R18]TRX34968.1 hypothetical protein FNW52_12565 [Flavobacterium sp. ZT3R18]